MFSCNAVLPGREEAHKCLSVVSRRLIEQPAKVELLYWICSGIFPFGVRCHALACRSLNENHGDICLRMSTTRRVEIDAVGGKNSYR
jgi:hypothetical protein